MPKYVTGLNKGQNRNFVLGLMVVIVVSYIIFDYQG